MNYTYIFGGFFAVLLIIGGMYAWSAQNSGIAYEASVSSDAPEGLPLLTDISSSTVSATTTDAPDISEETPVTSAPHETTNPNASQSDASDPQPVPKPAPAPVPTPVPQKQGITMAEVAQHDSKTSCWTAIDGSVYDLTSYISKHPGGASRIMSLCGIDGTRAFQRQHGGDTKPAQILSSLRIDSLAL